MFCLGCRVLILGSLAASFVCTRGSAAPPDPETSLREESRPRVTTPEIPGGPLTYLSSRATSEHSEKSFPNLAVLSASVTDGAGNAFIPEAGEPFFVRIDYEYDNPVCTPYTIERTVNGWANQTPEFDWGCGSSGTTYWWHYWGAWVLHQAGTYEVTVKLDGTEQIEESDESDNTTTISIVVTGDVTPEWALVKVDEGRALLGDGTDVVVGTMDDALDCKHPWLDGLDSKGRPRLLAASQNALGVDGSPLSAGHATALMGIALARGVNPGDVTGLAPDARYVTAEFGNRAGLPEIPVVDVLDAAGFLAASGAEVINMSWSWYAGSTIESQRGEGAITNLMADYLAYGRNIVCVPAVNQFSDIVAPIAPGAARNVITVGGLEDDLVRAWSHQNHGPTPDGRSKPDILGNNSADAVALNGEWRNGFPCGAGFSGTSFSAPFVTGAVAQMLDYGKHHAQSVDHKVIKAIILNSGVKALKADGSPWSHTVTQTLDAQQGTGILDLRRVFDMYSGGRQLPASGRVPGYAIDSIGGTYSANPANGQIEYAIGSPTTSGGTLDITLVWDRHTLWQDIDVDGVISAGDSFMVDPSHLQNNLDLILFRDGIEVDSSRSAVDTVEHIHYKNLAQGEYTVQIRRLPVVGSGMDEQFAVAWASDTEWHPAPPTVTLSSDVGSVTDLTSILVTVTFSQPVTNFILDDIIVTNATVTDFAGNGAVYTFNLNPAAPGPVSVTVGAGVAQAESGGGNQAATFPLDIQYVTSLPLSWRSVSIALLAVFMLANWRAWRRHTN